MALVGTQPTADARAVTIVGRWPRRAGPTSRSSRASVSSSRARWAAVDQRAGSHPDVDRDGTSRTTCIGAQEPVGDVADLLDGEPPGRQAGDVLDDVGFVEPR